MKCFLGVPDQTTEVHWKCNLKTRLRQKESKKISSFAEMDIFHCRHETNAPSKPNLRCCFWTFCKKILKVCMNTDFNCDLLKTLRYFSDAYHYFSSCLLANLKILNVVKSPKILWSDYISLIWSKYMNRYCFKTINKHMQTEKNTESLYIFKNF